MPTDNHEEDDKAESGQKNEAVDGESPDLLRRHRRASGRPAQLKKPAAPTQGTKDQSRLDPEDGTYWD